LIFAASRVAHARDQIVQPTDAARRHHRHAGPVGDGADQVEVRFERIDFRGFA
jgi:hypothetical protein